MRKNKWVFYKHSSLEWHDIKHSRYLEDETPNSTCYITFKIYFKKLIDWKKVIVLYCLRLLTCKYITQYYVGLATIRKSCWWRALIKILHATTMNINLVPFSRIKKPDKMEWYKRTVDIYLITLGYLVYTYLLCGESCK